MAVLSAPYFLHILRDGLVLSLGLSLIILGALYINPRIMLRSYPPAVQAQLTPLSRAEQRQQRVMGGLVWGFALAGLLYSNVQLAASNGPVTYALLFANTYLVLAVFNLFDLLVIDYLLLLVIKPAFLFVPGTQALGPLYGFGYHFRGFLKGLVFGAVISAVVAVVALLLV